MLKNKRAITVTDLKDKGIIDLVKTSDDNPVVSMVDYR